MVLHRPVEFTRLIVQVDCLRVAASVIFRICEAVRFTFCFGCFLRAAWPVLLTSPWSGRKFIPRPLNKQSRTARFLYTAAVLLPLGQAQPSKSRVTPR